MATSLPISTKVLDLSAPMHTTDPAPSITLSEEKANGKATTIWRKVYSSIGFKKGYNFSLCKHHIHYLYHNPSANVPQSSSLQAQC